MFKSAVTMMIPLLFASVGGLFPVLAGTLNIALEGLLLAGAFSSLAVYYATGSVFSAITAGIITGTALSALHAFAVFKLRANLFISALAVNLFSSGLCVVFSDKLFGTRGVVVSENVTGLQKWYVIAGIITLAVSWLAIYKTPFGYRLRACEKDVCALVSLGIRPQAYQTTALLISGFLCGIGGSFLSLNLGAFVPGMSAGKGWIALAVIFLGGRNPLGVLFAAFIFSLAEAFSNYSQGFMSLPADFLLAFPYITALIALIFISIFPRRGTN
ncbi:MAG: ABC transporter permease [Treponema sp.]|jgi:simple sugar transport system permease protein|nr:ABC transporter permease [Treponema sp.]